MAAQYDFNPGLDISPLSSVTKDQLIQALAQIAPLTNIGGVILQAGAGLAASYTEGTNGSPDVTNNPRFARYVWLNSYNSGAASPTPYFYNSSDSKWYANSIAALSITNAEISASAAISLSKLAAGTANYLIRCNGSGVPTYVAASSALVAGDNVPPAAINPNGSNAFLSCLGSANPAWITDSTAATRIIAAVGSNVLPVTVLQNGTANYVIQMSGGAPAWIDINAAILAASKLDLTNLKQTSATSNQAIVWNGSAWVPTTLSNTTTFNNSGAAVTIPAAGASTSVNHGLSAIPRHYEWYLKNKGNSSAVAHGYAVGDAVNIGAFRNSADFYPSFVQWANITAVGVALVDITRIQHKTTGALTAMTRAEVVADFDMYVNATV